MWEIVIGLIFFKKVASSFLGRGMTKLVVQALGLMREI